MKNRLHIGLLAVALWVSGCKSSSIEGTQQVNPCVEGDPATIFYKMDGDEQRIVLRTAHELERYDTLIGPTIFTELNTFSDQSFSKDAPPIGREIETTFTSREVGTLFIPNQPSTTFRDSTVTNDGKICFLRDETGKLTARYSYSKER